MINYYVTYKREEILDFSLLSHFYAYVMEGLCDVGEYELAKQAMKKLNYFNQMMEQYLGIKM